MVNDKDKLAKNWRDIASQIYSDSPDWNSGQIHRELKKRLGETSAPGLSAVQKWRQERKPRMDEIEASGIDNPWHLGTLREHPLPADIVTDVLILKEWASKGPKRIFGNPDPRNELSIRQALWYSRLKGMIEVYLACVSKKWLKGKDIEEVARNYIWDWTEAYADFERICDIAEVDCNTNTLDKSLVGGGLPLNAGDLMLATLPFEKRITIVYDKDGAFERGLKESEK